MCPYRPSSSGESSVRAGYQDKLLAKPNKKVQVLMQQTLKLQREKTGHFLTQSVHSNTLN